MRHPNRWRGRPRNQDAYPIYPCQDGYVRLCVMSPRQWHGLRRWLGEPEEFQDPEIRRDRHPLRGLAQDRCADRAVVRRPDDESVGLGRPGARRADFGRAGSRADPGVRAFPGGRRDRRRRARARGAHAASRPATSPSTVSTSAFALPRRPPATHEARWLAEPASRAGARESPASVHSTGCASSTSASSSPAANSAGCSATSAPRSSRSKVPPIPTDCGRRGSARR